MAHLSKVKTALEISTIARYRGLLTMLSSHAAATNALLFENANSVAIIQHSMNIKAAMQHLNPGQSPINAADQLL